jgi:carbon-monoxide dehydrogenase medium subunit
LHTPRSVAEAIGLLEELAEARVMAGGTDLLVDIKQGLTTVQNIVSLQEIQELKGIEKTNGGVRIGALVTAQETISSSLVDQHVPALADAARSMASYQIRSVATIGGNVSSAVPSADLPPSLIAAEAAVELRCAESCREIPLSDFFVGPRESVCGAAELLTSILIPFPPPNTGSSYQRFALREGSALAVASVASRITLVDGAIGTCAIVLGAVAPRPVRASRACDVLVGREPSDELFAQAASIAKDETEPISDIRGSVWYRRELVYTLTCRTLTEALKRCQCGPGGRE